MREGKRLCQEFFSHHSSGVVLPPPPFEPFSFSLRARLGCSRLRPRRSSRSYHAFGLCPLRCTPLTPFLLDSRLETTLQDPDQAGLARMRAARPWGIQACAYTRKTVQTLQL
jgi:hypothetical protein